jgi:hypothetical protein
MLVLATGREFLPAGGFSGRIPATPLQRFVDDIRSGRVADVAVAVQPLTRNPDMLWVVDHCNRTGPTGDHDTPEAGGRTYRAYICWPAEAGG